MRKLTAILGIISGIYIALFFDHPQLTDQSLIVLSLLVTAIAFWISNIIEDYIVSLLMAVGWVSIADIPFEIAFAVFASSTWWMVLAALGLGAAVAKSGLLHRLGIKMLMTLPANFFGQTLGLFISGVVFCPAIPSVIGKVAISSRFVHGMAESLGLEKGSSHSAGLFFVMYLGFALAAPLYLTGSATNFLILELIPGEVSKQIDWLTWFVYSLPVSVFLLGIGYLTLFLIFKPADELKPSKEYLVKQLKELGPMSRKEKFTTLILILTLFFWITEMFHGIPAVLIAISGMSILIIYNVIDRSDVHSKIPWSFLIFFGITMNVGRVFEYVQLDHAVGETVTAILGPYIESPVIFLTFLVITVYVLRYIFVSYNALLVITLLVLVPITGENTMNPWLIGLIILYACQAVWTLRYQNQVFNIAFYGAGGMVTAKQSLKTSLIFMAITLASVLMSIPYWRFLGVLE